MAASALKTGDRPAFLYVSCQVKAESALKAEMSRRWPDFRFAFSRPGFVTFKLPADHRLADDFSLDLVLGRSYGFSLGRAEGPTFDDLAVAADRLLADAAAADPRPFDHLAVWPKDKYAPGEHSYEPGPTPESKALETQLAQRWNLPVGGPLPVGKRILNVALLDDAHWWLGWHRQGPGHLHWPGGLCSAELPEHAASRAYLKAQAALEWSRLPVKRGDWCVELGSSPGGASQALLDRGLKVLGVDPAEMHPAVLAHRNFTHINKRAHEVPRRDLREVRWLLADMNVAPQYTLSAARDLATSPHGAVSGVLLTLKLLDWKFLSDLPRYLSEVESWGFTSVRARQLSVHRREFCLTAVRK